MDMLRYSRFVLRGACLSDLNVKFGFKFTFNVNGA
jgi:hypothetical protein